MGSKNSKTKTNSVSALDNEPELINNDSSNLSNSINKPSDNINTKQSESQSANSSDSDDANPNNNSNIMKPTKEMQDFTINELLQQNNIDVSEKLNIIKLSNLNKHKSNYTTSEEEYYNPNDYTQETIDDTQLKINSFNLNSDDNADDFQVIEAPITQAKNDENSMDKFNIKVTNSTSNEVQLTPILINTSNSHNYETKISIKTKSLILSKFHRSDSEKTDSLENSSSTSNRAKLKGVRFADQVLIINGAERLSQVTSNGKIIDKTSNLPSILNENNDKPASKSNKKDNNDKKSPKESKENKNSSNGNESKESKGWTLFKESTFFGMDKKTVKT
jgi:hypothetical protein